MREQSVNDFFFNNEEREKRPYNNMEGRRDRERDFSKWRNGIRGEAREL